MALLSFPANPNNGDIFPVSPPAGVNIYQWDSTDQTWRLLGPSSGVAAGTYGTSLDVPQITIDATGRITLAQNVAIQLGSTTQVGLVQLVDDTVTNDDTKALTAAMGFYLQNQIGDVTLLNPFYPNLVTAINTLGTPTGVTPGTYGSGLNVAQFTVNANGRITSAANVPLSRATTLSPGVVQVGANLNVTGAGLLSVPAATASVAGVTQLVDDTVTNNPTKALTAAAGYDLQLQIDALAVKGNLTFAGSFSAATGLMTKVSPEGAAVGFAVGSPLPLPLPVNDEYFVIVVAPGTYTPPGGVPTVCSPGDWFISDGSQWLFYDFAYGSVTQVNTGGGLTGGPITTTGTISMLPATTSTIGGVIPDGTSISVTPSGRISAVNTGTVTSVGTGSGLTGGPITSSGTISVVPATTTTLGGVIPDGTTISVSPSGVISAAGPVSFKQLDDLSGSFNGTAQNFPLTIGGVAYTPGNSANLIISVGGVMQVPGSSFSISGSTLQFTSAPPTSSTFVGYVVTNSAGGSGGGPGSVTSVGTGAGLTGGPITTTGTVSLVPATTSSIGGVIPDGVTVSVDGSGGISVPPATTTQRGAVIPDGVTISVSGLGNIALGNTSVIPGTYTLSTITVDGQGRITSASSGSGVVPQFLYFDDIIFDGVQSVFTLEVSGVPYAPTPSTNLMVTVGGVPQPPGTAYTVAGSTITFLGAPPPAGVSFLAVTVA